ncbi:MAG TPA: glycosyltransferase [Acidimicrobiia bacterium]
MTTGGSAPTPHSVSVIVPTFRPGDGLRAPVDAALDDPSVVEVVVVLDRRAPMAADAVERLLARDERVRVTRAPAPGPSVARAHGVELARGDVVLFLDDDVVPAHHAVTGHLRRHAEAVGRVVVGYMPVAVVRLIESATARIYARDYEVACREYDAGGNAVLRNLWGGNVSMRRTDAQRVGIATERFPFTQHEDRELGLRCLDAGLQGVFDRSLTAEHRYEREPERFLRLAREQVEATRAIHELHPKTAGPWDAAQYRAGVPKRARWLVGAARTPAVARGEVSVLRALAGASHALGARRVEGRALVLARVVVQDAAARAVEGQWATSAAMPATIITKPRAT